MTEPNFKNFNQILSDMMADLASKGTRLTDMNPGSIIRTLLEVYAAKLDEGNFLAEQIINLFFVATTTGTYLDSRVAERGITRRPGTKATGILTAARSTPAPFGQMIPQGTTFETEDHIVLLETTAEATMAQGTQSVSLPVRAVNVGAAGNLQAGTSLKQVGVAVSLIETVTVAAPGLLGGSDTETDDEMRRRYMTVIRSPGTSGNIADYMEWAMEIDGVGGVYVQPLCDGPGTVKLYLLGADKAPAAPELVDLVQVHISPSPAMGEGKAPVGATVTCVAATQVDINVSATIISDGSKSLNEVKTAFENALVDYLKDIAFSDNTTVRYSRVASLLLDTQGVTDYDDLVVNGGDTNITVSVGFVAVKGTVTLT